MAIPSYTGIASTKFNQGDYLDYINDLVGVVGRTYVIVQQFMIDLKDLIGSHQTYYPGLVDSDGLVHLNKAPGRIKANYSEAIDCGIKIYGVPLGSPVFYGWVNGERILAFGSYAMPYLYGAEFFNPYPAPVLVCTETGEYAWPGTDGLCAHGGPIICVTFMAVFLMDTYEESNQSNTITLGPFCGWSTATLAVTTDSIPSNAIGVRYYEFFPSANSELIGQESYADKDPSQIWVAGYDRAIGAFRLVSEVMF